MCTYFGRLQWPFHSQIPWVFRDSCYLVSGYLQGTWESKSTKSILRKVCSTVLRLLTEIATRRLLLYLADITSLGASRLSDAPVSPTIHIAYSHTGIWPTSHDHTSILPTAILAFGLHLMTILAYCLQSYWQLAYII